MWLCLQIMLETTVMGGWRCKDSLQSTNYHIILITWRAKASWASCIWLEIQMVGSPDNIRIWIFKTTESGLEMEMTHVNRRMRPPVNKILNHTSHSYWKRSFHYFHYIAFTGKTCLFVVKQLKTNHASRRPLAM